MFGYGFLSVVLVLYLAAPSGFKGTFNLDTRFVVLAGFLLFGGMMPVAAGPEPGLPKSMRLTAICDEN